MFDGILHETDITVRHESGDVAIHDVQIFDDDGLSIISFVTERSVLTVGETVTMLETPRMSPNYRLLVSSVKYDPEIDQDRIEAVIL